MKLKLSFTKENPKKEQYLFKTEIAMIYVKHPLGMVEYTEEELEKELEDLSFLRHAFLVILNPEVTSKSDIPFTKDEVIKIAKEMYLESNYSNDFIEQCFKLNKQ